MVKLKKLGVWSLAKFQAVIMAMMGLVIGVIFAVMSLLLPQAAGGTENVIGIGGLGMWVIIAMPIIYGVIGLVGGAIGALLFNLTTKIVGGLEMEFEE